MPDKEGASHECPIKMVMAMASQAHTLRAILLSKVQAEWD